MLPWASWDKEKQRDKYRREVDDPLDCSFCMKTLTQKERSHAGCGWIVPADRLGRFRGGPADAPSDEECPGYAMRLPEVHEAARALGWKKDGHLSDFYPDGLTPLVFDALDLLDAEIRGVERHAMRASTEDAKRGH